MPSIAWKNTLYRTGTALIRPAYNHDRKYEGEKPSLKKIALQHMLQRGTILYEDKGNTSSFLTGTGSLPPENAWYHTASIAKMVSALGALIMVEEGLLSLERPICEYSVIPVPKGVTLRHLLTHTSGIPDTQAYADGVASRRPLNQWWQGDLSSILPGTAFQYSNFAFGLVGSLMEEASGQCLENWMNEKVFSPLQMDATYDLTRIPPNARLISSKRLFPPHKGWNFDAVQRRQKALPLHEPDPQTHYGLTAGGLFATARGLKRLVDRLAAGGEGLLSPAMVSQMLRPAIEQDCGRYRCGFGMGIFCLTNTDGRKVYGHQGLAYGAVQGAFWDPSSGQKIVSLNGGADETRIGRMCAVNLSLINSLMGGGTWI